MADISLPDMSLIWGSSGDVLKPSDSKIQQGWAPEIPARQWFNWLDNRQDQAIAHIAQHGIAVWSSTLEYQAGKSYVQGSNGKIFLAINTSIGEDPVLDVTETMWVDILKPGYVVINTTGVSTFTVPAILKLGIKKAFVTVIGAGGGGAKRTVAPGPGGGGGGGVATKLCDLTGVSTVSITVGSGGVGATVDGTNGGSGGASSFGAYCSATGGAGGTFTGNQAVGGIGTGGDLNSTIGPGSVAVGRADNTSFLGGAGGGGYSIAAQIDDVTPVVAGAGGGGRNVSNAASGANGRVIISW